MCRCVPDFPEADGRPDAGRIRLKERAFFVRKGRESLYFWPGGWYTTSTIVMNGNALPAVAQREPPGVQGGGTALRRSPGSDAGMPAEASVTAQSGPGSPGKQSGTAKQTFRLCRARAKRFFHQKEDVPHGDAAL